MAGGVPGRTIPLPFVPSLLVWSDDGARLVVGGAAGAFADFGSAGLAVVDTAAGAVMWRFDEWNCTSAVIAGPRLVTALSRGEGASFERQVAVFDLASGERRWFRAGAGAPVAADPSGRWLVAGATGEYLVLGCDDGAALGRVDVPPVLGFRQVISPAGDHLAVADGTRVLVAGLPGGTVRHATPVTAQPIIVGFDEVGGTLTAVGWDASVTVLDVASGSVAGRAVLDGARLADSAVARAASRPAGLNPDGRLVAVSGTSGTGVFSVRTGVRIATVATPPSVAVRTGFSPDGRLVTVTRIMGDVAIVDAPYAVGVRKRTLDVRSAVAFDRAGRMAVGYRAEGRGVLEIDEAVGGAPRSLAAGDAPVRFVGLTGTGLVVSAADRFARVHSADTGELRFEHAHPGPLVAVVLVRGGSGFVTACADGRVRLFDAAATGERVLVTHAGPVNALAHPPGAEIVFTAGGDRTVRCVEPATGTERWRAAQPGVTRMAASPDARFVVVACSDRTARLLDAADGAELWRVPHDARVTALAVAPGGAAVATAGEDGAVRVLGSAKGEIIRTAGHAGAATAVAFSPDGRAVVSGSFDGTVLASSLVEPAAPPTETARAAAPVTQLLPIAPPGTAPSGTGAPAAGGPWIVVVTEDGMVRVVDPALQAELARFPHPTSVNDTAAAPGTLATAATDGTIRLWPWP